LILYERDDVQPWTSPLSIAIMAGIMWAGLFWKRKKEEDRRQEME